MVSHDFYRSYGPSAEAFVAAACAVCVQQRQSFAVRSDLVGKMGFVKICLSRCQGVAPELNEMGRLLEVVMKHERFLLAAGTVTHLCVDMQRLFAEKTAWQVPWLPEVLPAVTEIAGFHAARTVFSRFAPPATPDTAEGAWRAFYERWPQMTRDALDPGLLELVEPLARFVPPARVIDKPANSVFSRVGLAAALKRKGITTLVITGGETDVCVLATVMQAIDLGFRVVLPTDALCSTSDGAHDALVKLFRTRFSSQVEATTTEEVLSRWPVG